MAIEKRFIWYLGFKCYFELEVNDIDLAQYWLDYYRKLGFKSCALHEHDKHQIFVSMDKA